MFGRRKADPQQSILYVRVLNAPDGQHWRTVLGVEVHPDRYRIDSRNVDHPDEEWEFDWRDVVRTETRRHASGGLYPHAIALVRPGLNDDGSLVRPDRETE